jgi:hypothetical protein
MYFPYLRGRQFELIALRELLEEDRINDKIVPVIEPIKPSTTLLKTLQEFVNDDREIAVVFNPIVGDFTVQLNEMCKEGSSVANQLYELLTTNEKVIKSYIMDNRTASEIKEKDEKAKFMIVNSDRDCLDAFLEAYDDTLPRFTLIPDDRAFKRVIPNAKVLFEDNFNKKSRNVEYIEKQDEFFSDSHLFYQNENFVGFADYSVIGEGFNESGFAPTAVAIHIVYFDERKQLRIHHFVSDTNDGIKDPGGKFGEALEKLVSWCKENGVQTTLGLQGFYDCQESGRYPGLGTAKKYSIMHHIELVSDFLGGKQ